MRPDAPFFRVTDRLASHPNTEKDAAMKLSLMERHDCFAVYCSDLVPFGLRIESAPVYEQKLPQTIL
jgi:hypothetical protein